MNVSVSVVLIRGCRDTYFAVIARFRIILLVIAYFSAPFFPFTVPEEGVALELRGTSKFEDATTEALGGTVGEE